MQSSEAAKIIFDSIYPRLYFLLPRLPGRPSPTRLNERLFSILLLLEAKSKKEKTLTIGEIGELCKLSSSDITRKIKDLEKRGFVRRSSLKTDERSKEVSLTPQGIQVLLGEKESRKRWFKKILEVLDEKERTFLINVFLKILKVE